MATVVRAALVQATWTGDTASMIAEHEGHARGAARRDARIIGFQEVLDAPYFCQVQDEVWQQWAFYRDRRPAAYEGLVQP